MELTGGTQRAGGGVASAWSFRVAGGWTRGASSRGVRGATDGREGRSGEGLALAGPRRAGCWATSG